MHPALRAAAPPRAITVVPDADVFGPFSMTHRFRNFLGIACALLLCACASPGLLSPQDDFSDKFLMLGTGPTGGAFRPIGESICDAVNEDRERTRVRCVPVATAGSTFNLHAVSAGSIQLGIAQEDLLVQMYNDRRRPAGRSLRSIALLHTSPIAVVARKSAGISDLRQIAGKRVNLGNRGSGQFAVTAALLRALELPTASLGAVTYLPTSDFESAFCAGKVDVVVEAVAHPSPLFAALLACGGQFVDIPDAVVHRMIAENRMLSPMEIPAIHYDGQERPVRTLGMRNVLFTQAGVDDEAVFRLSRSLQGDQAELLAGQRLLSSMPTLTPSQVGGHAVPLHPGARRALLSSPKDSR